MSYILNALRKSEQERQKIQEQNLTTRLQDNKPGKSSIHVRWLLMLIGLNGILLGYVLFKNDNSETAITTPKPTKPKSQFKTELRALEAMPPVRPKSPEKMPEPLIQSSPASETISALVNSKRPISNAPPTITELEPEAEITPVEKQPTTLRNQPREAEENKGYSASAVPANRAPKTTNKSNTERTVESEESFNQINTESQIITQHNDIPWLADLPSVFRRNVPDLDINVYVYSDLPENRFIMVSMHKYRVGQVINSGMTLKAIDPDGIVVEYRDRQFKIRRN